MILCVFPSAHVVNSVNDDPMVQQMTIIRGYIQQARDANRSVGILTWICLTTVCRFDEVSMLETNLKMLQEEFKRQKISENPPETSESTGYVSFTGVNKPQFDEAKRELTNGDATGDTSNPFASDSEDEYDASGKNPFAE